MTSKSFSLVILIALFCMASCLSQAKAQEIVTQAQSEQIESKPLIKDSEKDSTLIFTPTKLDKRDQDNDDNQDDESDEHHKHRQDQDREHDNEEEDDDLSLLRQHGAFIGSFLSILITEIGDKTFIVTAVLATKYNKLWVFIGSYGALFLMTLISCFIGNVSLAIINPQYIKYLAAALFFIFGFKAVYEAATNKIEDDEEEIEHDLKELEEKIAKRAQGENYHPEEEQHEENKNLDQEIGDQAEENRDLQQNLMQQQQKQNKINSKNVPNTFIAAQTFAQNFLGEWGDRSQISTIAMSASFDFFKVFLGCALGHAACSYLAITGGKLLAEKFSERTLTLAGGILFIIYGIATLFSI